jgi:ABC-2 type transport system permease protein
LTAIAPLASREAPGIERGTGGSGKAFLAVLRRDVYVTGKEFHVFLAQVILQPLFLLFVFGRILGSLGYTSPGYKHVLFPGIVGFTAVLTAIQQTALPLVIDFSFTKEIEDRLLAPLPVAWVAIEKMVFASMRSLVAAVVMFPVGILVLGSIPWRAGAVPVLVVSLLLGSFVGSAIGLTLGTLIPPNKINIVFALVLLPITFTGCTQYPWPSLHRIEWFQWVTTLNPLTYVSEAMRGALVPGIAHMRPWVCILLLIVSLAVFGTTGIRGFMRRALD